MTTRFFAALAIMLAFPGCNGDGDQNGAANGRGAGNGAAPAWEGTMTLDVMDAQQLKELIARHQGQVVVVQFWSSWCEPCKRMLPELVELQKQFGTQVAAISVNTDYHAGLEQPPESLRAEVEPILRQHDARFENVISATPDEQLFAEFGMATNGVIVYDRNGRIVERFQNPIDPTEPIGFTFDRDIEPLVRKLLAERA